MNFSGLYKQLKKRLRLKRRVLSLGAVVLVAGAAAGWLLAHNDEGGRKDAQSALAPIASAGVPDSDEDALAILAKQGKKQTVMVIRSYVCGEETDQLGAMWPEEIQSLHEENPGLSILLKNDRVVMQELIDDLSPSCKDSAYFGMDKDGNLSLFDGVPAGQKVIRTFFQLNVGFLESSLQREAVEQLKEGIRVKDLLEYNSVLSTFSEFAVEE
ncbi:BofC C-terminal domain-containing protein [Paenibacillus koleovorans]|uniref:BofC C-terminal domain-containing protein n=1 Tax=Paenibacillus koleovorans TaxID=121608 RepID=UPI000FDC3359|nr:BofC C-terminal domain-containing protein [Paenibacillus koleovorans]